MTNIREKYSATIAAIREDVQANIEEAKQLEKERTNEMQKRSSVVEDLRSTANVAHRSFFKVVFSILRLAFKKAPSPEEVSRITQPCDTYMTAAAQLPEAEKALFDAKISLSEAMEMRSDAECDLVNINSLG